MPVLPEVRPFETRDIETAAGFLAARHRSDRERFPILPERFEAPEPCAELIRAMMGYADGLAADVDGKLTGFMFSIKNTPSPTSGSARFGPVRGSMVFAHGHAVAPGHEPYPVYNALFGALAERYMSDGIFDHTAHVPAGDRDLDEAWSSLAFGRNAAVAARSTEPLARPAKNVEIQVAGPEDLDAVYTLAAAGNAYHARPPMFVPYVEPNTEEDVRAAFRTALADETQAILLGFADRKPSALLWVEGPKGSPLFTPDDSCYIGDTAVAAEARSAGVGTAMLSEALTWAREHGYRHATLHFLTANPLSSAFWQGHGFQPVMYHLRRRLDERIAWAQPKSADPR